MGFLFFTNEKISGDFYFGNEFGNDIAKIFFPIGGRHEHIRGRNLFDN